MKSLQIVTIIGLLAGIGWASLAFSAPGLFVDQETIAGAGKTAGPAGKVTLLPNKFRIEDKSSITIGRIDRKLLWMFDTDDHSYLEVPMLQDDDKKPLSKDLFFRTGRTQKIGEWNCYEVKMNPAKRAGWFEAIDSLTLWISTKPYPEAATYFASLFQAMGIDQDQLAQIQETIGKGFPIEMHLSMLESNVNTRVKKIEAGDVSPSLFDPLPGYRKQSLDAASPSRGMK